MGDSAKLVYKNRELELPVITGTEHESAVDISKLRAATGLITLDDGYVNTGSTTSAITFLDGEQGILRYRGYPIEAVGRAERFCRDQLPADLRRTADQGAVGYFRNFAAAAHDAARGHEIVLRRLPARCPSDGDSLERGRGAVDVLSRFARSSRSAAGRNFGPSADGQAADDRRVQLQEIDRAAVHVSAERFGLLPELFAHDVRRAVRDVRGRSRFRRSAESAADRACRSRAELQHQHRADGRLERRQFVRLDFGRHLRPVGPAARRGQPGLRRNAGSKSAPTAAT